MKRTQHFSVTYCNIVAHSFYVAHALSPAPVASATYSNTLQYSVNFVYFNFWLSLNSKFKCKELNCAWENTILD